MLITSGPIGFAMVLQSQSIHNHSNTLFFHLQHTTYICVELWGSEFKRLRITWAYFGEVHG